MTSDPKETAAAGADLQLEVAAGPQREQVTSAADGECVAAQLSAAMAGSGYGELALDRLLQAFRRALAAALWPSQRLNPGRPARVSWQVNETYVLVEVEGWEAAPAGPPLQGPHAPQFRRPPAGGDGPVPRSYAWLRCHRLDRCLEVCSYSFLEAASPCRACPGRGAGGHSAESRAEAGKKGSRRGGG
jgi:hypothetical protein